MKTLKSSYYLMKKMCLQVCLIVGTCSVLSYVHDFAQDNINTVENKAKCATTKKINPSYADKIHCSSLDLLDLSKTAEQKITQALN